MDVFEWELIYRNVNNHFTSRAKVIGGWIVEHRMYSGEDDRGNDPISIGLVFIPDPEHKWYVIKNLI